MAVASRKGVCMGVFDNDPNRPISEILEDLRLAGTNYQRQPGLIANPGGALLVKLARETSIAISGLNQSVQSLENRIVELDAKNGKLQSAVFGLTIASVVLAIVQAGAALVPFFQPSTSNSSNTPQSASPIPASGKVAPSKPATAAPPKTVPQPTSNAHRVGPPAA